MKTTLLELLADPDSGRPITLVEADSREGEITEGTLASAAGERYAITGGIPRFVVASDAGQAQTAESFAYKWRKREAYEGDAVRRFYEPWLLARYGFDSADDMKAYFAGHRLILDAGCGAGFSSEIWVPRQAPDTPAQFVLADVSTAVDVARTRLGSASHQHYVQADVMRLPFPAGAFDLIISEGVLHHTPSTEAAFNALVRVLAPGGELMFYVYRRKAPLREFADDHIRDLLSHMAPDAAWDAMGSLTMLGQKLAALGVSIELPDDVPLLGIKAGRYDVQRLIYWNFVKVFWNPDLDFEMNRLINFDWYHPRYAHRQTEEQCRAWCEAAGLTITRFDVQDSGFTIRALRKS